MVAYNYRSADVQLLVSNMFENWKVYGAIKLPQCGSTVVGK